MMSFEQIRPALWQTAVAAVVAMLAILTLLPDGAEAVTFTVTKVQDTADGSCSVDDCSLREAILEANAAPGTDSVTVPAGLFTFTLAGISENGGATGDLDVTDDLVVIGAGSAATIVDAAGLDRVFDVQPGGSLRLEALAVTGGSPSSYGGGIRHQGVGLTLIDVVVEDNAATSFGGGVSSWGSSLDIQSSRIRNNTATSSGGGVHNWSGSALTIDGTSITGNDALSYGGGVYSEGTTTIDRATIADNTALGRGGGIGGAGSLTVRESSISGNRVGDFYGAEGGGIGFSGPLSIMNSTVSGNRADSGAGGVWVGNWDGVFTVELDGVTIANNDGGGAFVGGADLLVGSASLIVRGVVISGSTGVDCRAVGANSGDLGDRYNIVEDGSCIGSLGPAFFFGPGNVAGDPMLGPLVSNGGPTETHALLTGSPAIDGVPIADCVLSIDQRGVERPQGSTCDIGAYEAQPSASDADADGVSDDDDNCVDDPNPGQEDLDGDGLGDPCDPDRDGDGFSNEAELVAGSDPDHAASIPDDRDGDGFSNDDETGAGSDPDDATSVPNDLDGDGIPNAPLPVDNCPTVANAGQIDLDGDGLGDACDEDRDGDGFSNDEEIAAGSDPDDAASTPDTTGALVVTVEAPPGSLPGAQLAVWSASNGGSGGQTQIDGGGQFTLEGLLAGSDYLARIITIDGHFALLDAAVPEIIPTQSQSVTLVPQLPATLRVTVLAGSTPVEGVRLEYALADGTPRGIDLTGTDGTARPAIGFFGGERAEVRALVGRKPFFEGQITAIDLSPGVNELEVELTPLPQSTVAGTVRDLETGIEISAANVTVVQDVDGRSWTFQGVTNETGQYDIPALAGSAEVTAAKALSHVAAMLPVGLPDGGTAPLDFDLVRLLSVSVDLEVSLQRVGEFPVLLDLTDPEVTDNLRWYVAGLAVERQGSGGAGPLLVLAEPGETLQVCVAGFGLGFQCTPVPVTGTELTAQLLLREVGVIKARVVDSVGQPFGAEWTATLVRIDGLDRDRVAQVTGVSPDFQAPVGEAGTYELFVGSQGFVTVRRDLVVGTDQVVNLGDLVLLQPRFPFSTVRMEPFGLLVPGGTAWVTVAINGDPVENVRALLDVPPGTQLFSDSIFVDFDPGAGSPTTVTATLIDATTYEVALGNDSIVTLRYGLLVGEALSGSRLAVSPRVRFVDVAEFDESLPTAVRGVAELTLNAPSVTNSLSLTVGGQAFPGRQVSVYDGNVLLGSAEATRGGSWELYITLPDIGDITYHYLVAETDSPLRRTKPVDVLYDSLAPNIELITMRQTAPESVVSFNPNPTAIFTWPIGTGEVLENGEVARTPIVFEVLFSDPSLVRNVVARIGESGAPLTRGLDDVYRGALIPFEPTPGQVFIDFDLIPNASRFREPPPPEDEARRRLPPIVSDYVLTAFEQFTFNQLAPLALAATTGESQTGSVTLQVPQLEDAGINFEVTLTELFDFQPSAADQARAEQTGVPVFAVDVDVSATSTSMTVTGSLIVEASTVIEPTASAGVLALSLDQGGTSGEARSGTNQLSAAQVTPFVEVGFTLVTDLDQTRSILGMDEAVQNILDLMNSAASCQGDAGAGLRSDADFLRNLYAGGEATKLGFSAAGIFLGPETFGAGTVAMWGLGWASGLAIDQYVATEQQELKDAIANAQAQGECEPEPAEPEEPRDPLNPDYRDPDRRRPDADPRYHFDLQIYDPSGFVYEALEYNRLEGVVATIFRSSTDSGPWSVWDAEAFQQINPQITGADGRYRWDVPEDWWLVVYQLDGYELAFSDPLEVLPPHFDVNIGMRSLSLPQVESATISPSQADAFQVSFDTHMQVASVSSSTVTLIASDGSPLQATVTPVNEELDPEGRMLARSFTVTPNGGAIAGETYTLVVAAVVQNYTGRMMAAEFRADVLAAPNSPPEPVHDVFDALEDDALVVPAPGVLANDQDIDGQPLTAQLLIAPLHGTVALAADGSFIYVPDSNYSGPDGFSYEASDGAATAQTTVTVAVAPVNDPPVAVGDSFVVGAEPLEVGAPGLLGNDSDPDDPVLTAFVATQPKHGILAASEDGSFTYVPETGFSGTDGFSYQAWDGSALSELAPVTFTVQAALPVRSITGGGRFCFGETSCGPGGNTGVTINVGASPAGQVTVVLPGHGNDSHVVRGTVDEAFGAAGAGGDAPWSWAIIEGPARYWPPGNGPQDGHRFRIYLEDWQDGRPDRVWFELLAPDGSVLASASMLEPAEDESTALLAGAFAIELTTGLSP